MESPKERDQKRKDDEERARQPTDYDLRHGNTTNPDWWLCRTCWTLVPPRTRHQHL